MATDTNAGAPAGTGPAAPSKTPLLLALVNSLAVLCAAGSILYIKVIYKRPVITEQSERERLVAAQASPAAPLAPGMISFDSTTVNIAPSPGHPKEASGTSAQIQGKLHYVTLAFTLMLRDGSRNEEIDTMRPLIMDRLLSMLGHKTFEELTTVQGRYLLRSQILDATNHLVADREKTDSQGARAPGSPTSEDPLVTNVYFTQFVVQ